MPKEIRFTIGEPELRALIRGGVVRKYVPEASRIVAFILSDIGFGVIQRCLDDAIDKKDLYKDYEEKL